MFHGAAPVLAVAVVVAGTAHPYAPLVPIVAVFSLWFAATSWWARRDAARGSLAPAPAGWPGDALRLVCWRTPGRAAWSALSLLAMFVAAIAVGLHHPWLIGAVVLLYIAQWWLVAWTWWRRDQ